MAMTIAQLANLGLNQNQQTKLSQCKTIGDLLNEEGAINTASPDVTGAVTLAQSKTVLNFCTDLKTLISDIERGARHVRRTALEAASKAADDAAPAGSF